MAGLLDEIRKSEALAQVQQRLQGLLNIPTAAQQFMVSPASFMGLLGRNPLPRETGFAAGATGLPAQEMSVLDPNQAPYMQGYSQGEPVGYAGLALPLAAPAAVAGAKALGPKAGQALESYMVNQGMIQPLTAYHGTPHTIQGKFDINKVGTGEGAQAYGHGMYFAENPAVATDYANKLGYDYKYMGKTPKEDSPTDLALRWLKNLDWDKEAAKAQWKNEGLGAKVIQAIDKINLEKVQKPGNLYKVDIPDKDIPNMLNWDEPLSKQPAILEKLKGLGEAELSKLGINPDFTRKSTGKELTGESLYDVLTTHNSQKGASNLLAKQGITGIRYFDQNSRITANGQLIDVIKTPEGWKSKVKVTNRGGAGFQSPTDSITTSMPFKTEAEAKAWADNKIGKGTSNFVVFDPSDVKILEKNSEKVEGLLD